MKALRHVVEDCLHAPQGPATERPEHSLLHDCALYMRDLALATIIFVPIWGLLYLLRVLLVSH